MLKSSLRASNHPLSRALYTTLKNVEIHTISDYNEVLGKGIEASYKDFKIK